jgi:hypothetical protein
MVMEQHDPLVQMVPTKLVILNVAPSAENLAALMYNLMRAEGFKVAHVRVRETETSEAFCDQPDPSVRIMGSRA